MTNRTRWDAGDPHGPAGFTAWGEAISDDVDDLVGGSASAFVFFGDDPNVARPDIDGPVHWLGYTGTIPANAVEDTGTGYFDLVTTVEPAEEEEPVDAPTVAPANLSATTVSDTRIDLSWDAVGDATGYEYDVDEGTPVDVGDNLTAEVTGLTAGTSYDFRVRAYNSGGAGPWSAVVTESTDAEASAPAAPTNLTATGGDGQVSLTWTASAGADGHRVYRHTSDTFASASQVGSDLGASADEYTDETVTNDTEYWYWITAFNTAGESDPSTPDSATPAETSGGTATFTDDFNREDQLLTASDDWTMTSGMDAGLSIENNELVAGGIATDESSYVSSGSFADDQYAQLVVTNFTSQAGTQLAAVSVRQQDSTNSNYTLRINTASNLALQRKTNGSITTITSETVTLPSVPFTIRIEAQGSQVRCYLGEDEIISETDTTYTSGRPAIFLYSATTRTNVIVDDFEAGEL